MAGVPGRAAGCAVLAILAATLVPSPAPRAQGPGRPGVAAEPGDKTRGATAFRACLACHALEPGRHESGPSLAGVYGAPAGKAAGFDRYSPALAGAGFAWTPARLDAWLENPGRMLPGSRMTYLVADPQTRADLVAYLRALHDGDTEGLAIPRQTVLDLKSLGRAGRVSAIRHCRESFHVTLENGVVLPFWERNLRLRVDSSREGPAPGVPALLPGGMQGDRYTVIFHSAAEIGRLVEERC